jgi:adenosylcobinamide-GDP ribazoletransferase
LNKKFAGLTGDSYGAVNEFSEVATLIVVGLLAFNHWLWVA